MDGLKHSEPIFAGYGVRTTVAGRRRAVRGWLMEKELNVSIRIVKDIQKNTVRMFLGFVNT